MNRGNTNLSQLIVDARRDDPRALDRLLDSYRNYLRLLAATTLHRSVQSKADPSDFVQDALHKAARRFDQFRGTTEAELAGWLRQILARTITDWVRANRRSRKPQERSLEAVLADSSQAMERLLASEASTPSASAERRDLGVVLSDALAELPEDYRDVLVLRYLEEKDWPEVAETMGRSVAAVRKLWTRALKQLRPLIEDRI